jgi:hypothetical protein
MLLYKKEHSMDSIFLSYTGAHTRGDGPSVGMLNEKLKIYIYIYIYIYILF